MITPGSIISNRADHLTTYEVYYTFLNKWSFPIQ